MVQQYQRRQRFRGFLLWMLLATLFLSTPSFAFQASVSKQQFSSLRAATGDDNHADESSSNMSSRRQLFQAALGLTTAALSTPVHAAPPISVIAEELGYFPIQRGSEVMYVPRRVQRHSTDQAVELAKLLHSRGITFFGAYWCPHCSRQKEMFGVEAMQILDYRECSPKGYGFSGQCRGVDGFPSFGTNKKILFSGERPLSYFAEQVGFKEFDPSLEDELPAMGTACKLPKQ